ncbi:hypothetical protein P7C70_g1635, partial [Phenoliferia sp. Uapishka_3]
MENPPTALTLTSAYLEDLSFTDLSTVLLSLCNSTSTAREAVEAFRAAKDHIQAQKVLNFSFELSIHTSGVKSHYGRIGPDKFLSNRPTDGSDYYDWFMDVVMIEAIDEIEVSVRKIVKDTVASTTYRNKSHAAEILLGLLRMILVSKSALGKGIREDECIYNSTLKTGLEALISKCSELDRAEFKKDGFATKLEALDPARKNPCLQRYLAPILALLPSE